MKHNIPFVTILSTTDVPTESVPGSSHLFYVEKSPEEKSSQLGHAPNRHVLFDRWDEIRWALKQLAGTWKRTEMIMEALRLQAGSGYCYASAAYLAAAGFGSARTWRRLLDSLVERRLA